MTTYYDKSVDEVLKLLKSDAKGISEKDAQERLKDHGYNELPKEKSLVLTGLLLSQFKNALILLLIFAGFISLSMGESIEAIAIFSIVLLNVLLGFFRNTRLKKP